MKFFSANLKDLRELYVNSLQKALDMEQQITKALPTMVEKSTDTQLKQPFNLIFKKPRLIVTRLQAILDQMTGEAETIKCKVLSALVSETEDSIKDAIDPSVLDAALISAAQQVEHHEIAIYGTLRTWAGILGEAEQAATLEKILEEEKHADILLSGILQACERGRRIPHNSRRVRFSLSNLNRKRRPWIVGAVS